MSWLISLGFFRTIEAKLSSRYTRRLCNYGITTTEMIFYISWKWFFTSVCNRCKVIWCGKSTSFHIRLQLMWNLGFLHQVRFHCCNRRTLKFKHWCEICIFHISFQTTVVKYVIFFSKYLFWMAYQIRHLLFSFILIKWKQIMNNFNAKKKVILSNWILHNQSSIFHVNIPIYKRGIWIQYTRNIPIKQLCA